MPYQSAQKMVYIEITVLPGAFVATVMGYDCGLENLASLLTYMLWKIWATGNLVRFEFMGALKQQINAWISNPCFELSDWQPLCGSERAPLSGTCCVDNWNLCGICWRVCSLSGFRHFALLRRIFLPLLRPFSEFSFSPLTLPTVHYRASWLRHWHHSHRPMTVWG